MDFIGKVLGIGGTTTTINESTEETSNTRYNNSGQNLKPANSRQMAPPMVSKQNVSKQMAPPMVSKQNVSKQMASPMVSNRTASSTGLKQMAKPTTFSTPSKPKAFPMASTPVAKSYTGGYRKKSRSRSKKSKSKKNRSRRH